MVSKNEPSFRLYGEPLEELNEDDMWARKPVPVEEQIATDKQGRRRFHGAFTGGFSAGYFNTVGSEEGWKPATFQSSRSEKASKVQQRAEDFMDDEDQEIFGIAPKVLRARQEYKKAGSSTTSAPTGLLDSILKPVRDTVGVVLLKSMGWKQGQGIGPRQTAIQKQESRKLVKSQRVYGCAMGPAQQEDEDSEGDDESENRNLLFAPDDLPTFPVAPKTNSFGMGYTGLDKNSQLLSSTSHFSLFDEPPDLLMNSKKTGIGIKGQAFGVGAFEKEDDDIYTTDDVNRYDYFLESSSESKKRRLLEKHEMQKKKKQSAECLENFTPATLPLSTVTFYPAPQIPKHFVPKHGARQTRFSEQHPDVAKKLTQPRGRHDLSAQQRGLLVGEKMSTHQKRQEVTLAAKPMPILDFEVVPTEFKPGQFNPFVNNPLKLMRYRQYLTLKKMKQSEKIICLQPVEMTEWEKTRERNEFEQASILYQPLADMISDRFVSSSTLLGSKETPLNEEPKPLQETVKPKQFGQMKRTTQVWHPCALLCKRFNVPEPHSGKTQSVTKKKPNFSVFDFLAAKKPKVDDKREPDAANEPKPLDEPSTSMSASSEAPSLPLTVPNAPSPTPIALQQELPSIKPTEFFTTEKLSTEEKMDLFKMVFLSSSEDEDEQPVKEPSPPPKRRKSPPKGVFKTLDLLAPRTQVEIPEPAPPKPPEKLPEPSINLYGPALPPSAQAILLAASVSSTSSSLAAQMSVPALNNSDWVEKTKKHKRSSSHVNSHKKRKHSKDNKKDKDKRYSSDDSHKKEKKHKKHKR